MIEKNMERANQKWSLKKKEVSKKLARYTNACTSVIRIFLTFARKTGVKPNESAKSCAWRAHVLCVFTCFRAHVLGVLTCLACLRAYVLTSLVCLRAYMLGVLACLACFCTRGLNLLAMMGAWHAQHRRTRVFV